MSPKTIALRRTSPMISESGWKEKEAAENMCETMSRGKN